MNDKVINIAGKKTRVKRGNDARRWQMFKDQVSTGDVTVELKGIPINDATLVDMLGQYLLGLYETKYNEEKAQKMKKKRARAKVNTKSKKPVHVPL